MCRDKVIACAKHYVGDGGTVNGINENNTITDWEGLLKIHMPAYVDSIKKGVATVMISFSSWNGKKMHNNYDLITKHLKDALGFKVLLYYRCFLALIFPLNLNICAMNIII